jgi:hypothetical protein
MIDPSDFTLQALARNGVSPKVIDVVTRMTACLYAAADDVADTTGEDLFDDSNSRGFSLYRRGRNRIVQEFENDEGVRVSTAKNALHVYVDDCVISFYSARDGVDRPSLSGTSRTKRGVATEMQMQMEAEGMGPVGAPRRLVLMHHADEDGLVGANIGTLREGREWIWTAAMYDRFGAEDVAQDVAEEPGYEERDEAELPAIERRGDAAEAQSDDDSGS